MRNGSSFMDPMGGIHRKRVNLLFSTKEDGVVKVWGMVFHNGNL